MTKIEIHVRAPRCVPICERAAMKALDLICYCCDQEVARQRGGYGEERYEKEEFQNKVCPAEDACAVVSWIWPSFGFACVVVTLILLANHVSFIRADCRR